MAIVQSSVDTKRQKIADIVPLDSPLSMYVEPTRLCNFKCFFQKYNFDIFSLL